MKKFVFFFLLALVGTNLLWSQETAIDFSFDSYLVEAKEANQLSDLKGEVVYMSFWATWCKPCISNFKKYESVRSTLEEMGVIFLNVNIDDEESDWKRYLEKNPILGMNVRPNELALVKDQYQLFSIPLYHIVDKKGNIRYLSEDPDRDIFDEFRKLLSE